MFGLKILTHREGQTHVAHVLSKLTLNGWTLDGVEIREAFLTDTCAGGKA